MSTSGSSTTAGPRPFAVVVGFFAAALVAYAVVVPLGSASVSAVEVEMLARAQALRGGFDAGSSALWLLIVRAVALVPIGDVVVRSRLASVVIGALVAALVLARALAARREPATAAKVPTTAPVELVAAVLAAVTVALSRSPFWAATRVGPAAVGAALALGALLLAERIARDPSDSRAGMGLAVIAGLAASGPLAPAALGWPIGLALVLRALRRGERWPLLAPVLFVAAAGTSLLLMIRAPLSATQGDFGRHLLLLPIARALLHTPPGALFVAAREISEEIGVLALLVVIVGLLRTRRSALLFTLWPMLVGLSLRAAFGSGPDGAVGAIAALSAFAFPLSAGIVRLADRLGRARLPAAAAMGIIIAIWPLLAR